MYNSEKERWRDYSNEASTHHRGCDLAKIKIHQNHIFFYTRQQSTDSLSVIFFLVVKSFSSYSINEPQFELRQWCIIFFSYLLFSQLYARRKISCLIDRQLFDHSLSWIADKKQSKALPHNRLPITNHLLTIMSFWNGKKSSTFRNAKIPYKAESRREKGHEGFNLMNKSWLEQTFTENIVERMREIVVMEAVRRWKNVWTARTPSKLLSREAQRSPSHSSIRS